MHYLHDIVSHYGYLGIFFALTLGIVGLPIPDETLLAYVGYNVYEGRMSFALSILSAFLGSVTGITLSYLIGHKLGLPFLKKFGPKMHITEKKIDRTQKLFNKYGSALLFIGYFIPGVRHLTAYVAGISSLEFRKFMLIAYWGAFVWSFTFILLGYELGKRWFIVSQYVHHYASYLLTACVALALAVIAYMYIKKRKAAS